MGVRFAIWVVPYLVVTLGCDDAGGRSAPVKTDAAIGRGFNRGENDLEGHTDQTPLEPIIETAITALRKHLKGKADVSGKPTVKILDAGKSWIVVGRFDSPIDQRHDFQSIVGVDSAGAYEAGNLMLDDDVVMDKIITDAPREPSSVPAREPAPERTWTTNSSPFSVEATFVSKAGGKVKLKKADGKIITVDAEKLSDDDLQWIKHWAANR